MGTYVEMLLLLGPGLEDEGREWVIYEQPAWRYWSAQALQEITLRTRPVERLMDRIILLRHPELADNDFRLPFGARVDLWVYDFANRQRTVIQHVPIS